MVFPGNLEEFRRLLAALAFLLSTVALSYIMGCLRLKSGSVWPAVLVHAANNFLEVFILDSLTAGSRPSDSMLGKAGMITPAVTLLLTVAILWALRAKSPGRRGPAT